MGKKKVIQPKAGFVKVQKNNAYFKCFQVKYRRRREGKTDYKQRRALVCQDKNKYMTPKYRMVARITNRDVICQIVSAELKGDRVHASAYSHQLKDYGLKVGLTNYAACYSTGLLLARRILTLKGLADKYKGVKEVTGEYYQVEEKDDDRRPFRAYLDVGLVRTTVGKKVFACLKGAVDGGMLVPHSDKRFPGYNPTKGSLDAGAHRERILAQHVGEWMDEMEEEDPEKYKAHFSRYIEEGIDSEGLEELHLKVHAAIRADPKAKDPTKNTAERKAKAPKARNYRLKANRPLNLAQRQHKATQKINKIRRGLGMEARPATRN